jgi:phage tail sheath protein FI
MPITPSHPAIFPHELACDGRAIAAVPTSITAFVGKAARGPLDEPVALSDFADFERIFGGLASDSAMGFAVKAFFENGGGQALVVRVARHAKAAKLERGAVTLAAASEGSWGNQLRIRIRRSQRDAFHLQVRDGVTGRVEAHPNLTFRDSPRRIDRVVNAVSRLVRWTGDSPNAHDAIPEHAETPAPGKSLWTDDATSTKVERAARGASGGELTQAEFTGPGKEAKQQGLYALEKADLFNLLVIPPYRAGRDVDASLWRAAATYCEKRRAFLLIDPSSDCDDKEKAKCFVRKLGLPSSHAALFFPRVQQSNPVHEHRVEEFVASGAVAGVFARTDAQRGVWKAPAGLGATLNGVAGLSVPLSDPDCRDLSPKGINCLRAFPAAGQVVWGSRTLRGDDSLADDYKYVPVRRTALFLEESLYRGLRWVTFEPNDESLWAQIRSHVATFLHGCFRQGAFQGRDPRDAYFVKCGAETTSAEDVALGIVNVVVGFAPIRAAEFVTVSLAQMAGQTAG